MVSRGRVRAYPRTASWKTHGTDTVDKPNDQVSAKPEEAKSDSGSRPLVDRIKHALVTSRLTLGAQDTGLDPYDSRRVAVPGSVWNGRVR